MLDEISIVGFDDIPAAGWPSYALTTIRQPVSRMIETTIELMLARLKAPDLEPALRLIPGPLIERGSTRDRRKA